jgi:hypothetical protein
MAALEENAPQELGFSRQVLSIARIIQRLPPGAYTINISRPEKKSERWTLEVYQTVIPFRELIEPAPEEDEKG